MPKEKEPVETLPGMYDNPPIKPVQATKIPDPPEQINEIEKSPQGAIVPAPMDFNGMAKKAVDLEQVEIYERVMAAQERWEDRQAEKAFNTAMVEMQAKIPIFPKTEHVKYKAGKNTVEYWHAQYDKMMEILQPFLTEYGFAVNYSSPLNPHIATMIHVECIISHIQGHSKTYHSDIPIANSMGNATQNMGGTKFYGRRYALSDALNLSFKKEDNDARSKQEQPTPPNMTDEHIAEMKGLVDSKGLSDNDRMWEYFDVKKGRYDLIPDWRFDDLIAELRKNHGAS